VLYKFPHDKYKPDEDHVSTFSSPVNGWLGSTLLLNNTN
jgi:hypothetical protein